MAKKNPRVKKSKTKKSSPLNADLKVQLKAIDRLIEQGELEKAEPKLRAALKKYSKHGGLWYRLIDLLDDCNQTWEMALTAYRWSLEQPNSANAWGCLADASRMLGLMALADNATARYLELGQELPHESVGLMSDDEWQQALCGPFNETASKEDMTKLDIGQLYLHNGQYQQCIKSLATLSLLPARNNQAIALYQLGEIDAAYRMFLATWQQQSLCLLALGWAIKLALLQNDNEALERFSPLLKTARAVRMFDAQAQIEALLWLQENAAAWQLFQEYQSADWYHQDPVLLTFAAAAAAKNGDTSEARNLLQPLLEGNKHYDFTHANLDFTHANLDDLQRPAKERQGAIVTSLQFSVPATWLSAILKFSSNLQEDRIFKQMIEVFSPASNRYLSQLFHLSDQNSRDMVRQLLTDRAVEGDEDATQSLKSLMLSRQGTLSERVNIAEVMVEQGLLDPAALSSIWTGEEITEITLCKQEISDEPLPSLLSEEASDRLFEALELLRNEQPQESLVILERLQQQYPDENALYSNLSLAHLQLGNKPRALALLEQAVAMDPEYLIGRCNLVILKLGHSPLEEVEKLLQGLEKRPRLHTDEAFAYYSAMAQLFIHKREYDAAHSCIVNLENFARNDFHEKQVAELRRQAEGSKMVPQLLSAFETLKGLVGRKK